MNKMMVILFLLFGYYGSAQNHQLVMKGYVYFPEQQDSMLVSVLVYGKDYVLLEETSRSYSEDMLMTTWMRYSRPDKVAEKVIYNEDSSYFQRTIFERNKHGDIAKQKFYSEGKSYSIVHRNLYDSAGYLRKTIMSAEGESDNNNAPKNYTLYAYDSNGNIVAMKQYFNNVQLSHATYKYNQKYQKIEVNVLLNNQSPPVRTQSRYKYNDSNLLQVQEEYVDGTLESIKEYTWKNKILIHTKTTYPQQDVVEVITYLKQ